jgi:hypothetical protein
MRIRIDFKSLMIGGLLAVMLCLVTGATVRERLLGQVGRFSLATTQDGAWLVDTTTGQVWHANESARTDTQAFLAPKLPDATGGEKPAKR